MFISYHSAKANEPSSCNDEYESKIAGQRTYESPKTPIPVTQSSKNDIILDGRKWIVEPRDGMNQAINRCSDSHEGCRAQKATNGSRSAVRSKNCKGRKWTGYRPETTTPHF